MGLMARREGLALLQVQGRLRKLLTRRGDLVRALERLDELSRRPGPADGIGAELRDDRALREKLVAEAARLRAEVERIDSELAEVRAAMARHDHRKGFLEDTAKTARQSERDAAQARRDAAAPPRRPH